MPTFPCPHCERTIKVKTELAGRKGKCPHCGQPVTVPMAAAVHAEADDPTLPPRPAAAKEPAPPPAAAGGALDDTAGYVDSVPGPGGGGPRGDLTDFLAPPQEPGELGRLGGYRVLAVLGAGGMGVVYRAEDVQLQRPVALKAMLPGLAATDTARARFLREARSAAALDHDHIVHIYQVGEDRGVPYLAMQFLQGSPLDDRLKRQGKLPVPEVLRIGREAAEGLAAAHARGLIHRDIKPANIWLEGERARVKILDFGLARSSDDQSNLTQSGAIVGTPAYMAPEQARGEPLDGRCDLFSLGCVLYCMCTGQPAFKGTDTISTLMAVATEQPRPPRALAPEVPAALSDFILRLLAKKPDERPASARDVANALEGLERRDQTQVLPEPNPQAAPRSARKMAPPAAPPAPRSARKMPAPAAPPAPRSARKMPAPPPRPAAAAEEEPAPTPRRWAPVLVGVVVGLGLLAAGAYFLVPLLQRTQADQATLVLEADDGDVEVKVTRDGRQVALLGPKSKEVNLHAGTYQLEMVRGKDRLKLEKSQLVLQPGERQVARVVVAESAPAALPTGLGTPPPPGAVVLFKGHTLGNWVKPDGGPADWTLHKAWMEVGPTNMRTREDFGPDYQLHVEFWVPFMPNARGQGRGNSGVFLQGRYEVQILDSYDKATPDAGDCGALYGLIAPSRNACKPPQQWQAFDITFHAPRPRQGGRLTVVHNGITVIDNRPFDKVTLGAKGGISSAPGPVVLQSHGSAVRFRNIWLVPLGTRPAEAKTAAPKTAEPGFVQLFNGKDLTGWKTYPTQPHGWSVQNGILTGKAAQGDTHLFSERGDFANFHLHAEVRVNELGNSGIFFRAPFGLPNVNRWPGGYEAQVLHRYNKRDVHLTGSLHGLVKAPPLKLGPDQWFHMDIQALENHITIRVNGQVTAHYIDTRPRHPLRGHFALQVMEPRTTVVQFRKIEVKELPPGPR
jgi:hypothetical protein